MDLKTIKLIKNNNISLPKYSNGFNPGGYDDSFARDNISATLDMLNKQAKPNIGNITGAVGAGVQGAVNMLQNYKSYGYDKSVDDLHAQYGDTSTNVHGSNIQLMKFANTTEELDNVKSQANSKMIGSVGSGVATGASIGSVIPGIGTGVGAAIGGVVGAISGFFGGKKAKREAKRRLEEYNQKVAINNDFVRGLAETKGLNMDYIREHGNSESQSLYKDGKTPVYSPFGPINAEADSKVSKGEVAIDTLTGSRYRIPTGPNDTALFAGGKNPNTAIISNKYGLSDIAMENPELAIQLQKEMKDRGMLKKTKGEYKCGKMPKYKYGHYVPTEDPDVLGTTYELPEFTTATKRRKQKSLFQAPNVEPNFRAPSLEVPIPWEDPLGGKQIDPSILSINIPEYKAPKPKSPRNKTSINVDKYPVMNAAVHGLGALMGYDQYMQAKKDTPYRPNTYVANPYEGRALDILAGLNINQYPIMNQLRNAEARSNYALNNSGGLSGSQKYLGRIANTRNTQASIADALMKIQEQNNAYKAQYGNALMQAGAQSAANRMNALRADNDVYMRSAAARQQGMQTGLYNMQNNLQSWLANMFKYNQFKDTLGLYQQNLNSRR